MRRLSMANPTIESMAIMSPFAGNLRSPQTIKIVEAWHNETHNGAFQFCDQQPCHAINWARRGAGVPA